MRGVSGDAIILVNAMNSTFFPQNEAEHRRAPRVPVDFLALVRGRDTHGRRFTEPASLKNLSAGGLYLRLRHRVAEGERLFIAFRFASTLEVPALEVAAKGVVRRSEAQSDGRCGLGIMFQHYRTL